jgi:hypothetical protein
VYAENYQAGKEYGPLNDYHLRAWGDTLGDYELLSAAADTGGISIRVA